MAFHARGRRRAIASLTRWRPSQLHARRTNRKADGYSDETRAKDLTHLDSRARNKTTNGKFGHHRIVRLGSFQTLPPPSRSCIYSIVPKIDDRTRRHQSCFRLATCSPTHPHNISSSQQNKLINSTNNHKNNNNNQPLPKHEAHTDHHRYAPFLGRRSHIQQHTQGGRKPPPSRARLARRTRRRTPWWTPRWTRRWTQWWTRTR